MKHYSLILLLAIILGGCFNERGVSLKYYNQCEEYYDVQGYYHRQCDKNVLDYSDVTTINTNRVEGKIR